MPVESATTIATLDNTYPLGGDQTNQGDNHLRLIKNVLKLQFPGALGAGFAIPITATEAQLNFVTGVTSNIQSQIDANTAAIAAIVIFPTGTKMSFFQAAAPTGWTQDVTNNDAMLRVVSTAGGGTGGVHSPILNNLVPSHTHTVSGSTTGGSHEHTYNMSGPAVGAVGTGPNQPFWNTPTSTSGGGAHSHTVSGTAAANAGASNWTPKYVDMIICSKDP
jgi:hypothetical protein